MATKASEREKSEPVSPEAPPSADGPLLDLTDQAVRRMIKLAKKRGYVTYDELNEVLPSEEFTSEQIEDVLGQLSEQGINVVDNEDPEASGEERAPARKATTRKAKAAISSTRRARPCLSRSSAISSRPSALTIPSACICARWARSSCSRARAKSPSPSASRPAARR
jgi:hypothetical protein